MPLARFSTKARTPTPLGCSWQRLNARLYAQAVSWPADEVDLDEELVRSLIVDQHPDLAKMSLVKSLAGWDDTLWRLGNNLLVRLPRRAEAAPLVVNEQRWLPILAQRLPLPIPVPI